MLTSHRSWRSLRGLGAAGNLRLSALLLCACALLPLASCSSDGATNEVIVYVAVDRKDAEPILRNYEATTGIRVRAVYDAEAAKTTGLVTRLVAEREHPRCDLFWNNEIVQTMQLAEQGIIAQDDDGRWPAVAVRARVIVYNTNLVTAEEAPRSLRDLTLPKWRGKVAIADPQFGTTRTHISALFAAWGPEATQQYLNELLDNDVQIVAGNAMVKNLVGRAQEGASPILVGLTDTDDVASGQADGLPIEQIFPDQHDLGTLVIPSTVGVLVAAPHPDQAQDLREYLLGQKASAALTAQGTGYFNSDEVPHNHDSPLRSMDVSFDDVLSHLDASTRWTAAHFHR